MRRWISLGTTVMFLAIALLPLTVHAADYTLRGWVYDKSTSRSIPYAHYEIKTQDGALVYSKITDADGYFYVLLSEGTYIIIIFEKGYQPLSKLITVHSDLDIKFYLQPVNGSSSQTGERNYCEPVFLTLTIFLTIFVVSTVLLAAMYWNLRKKREE